MTHLTPDELVDLADGTLVPGRRAHLAACADCRAEAEALAATYRAARDVDVPEPSPLYWDHLSRRVREAIAAERTEDGGGWADGRLRRLAPHALAASLVATVAVVGWLALGPTGAPAGDAVADPPPATAAAVPTAPERREPEWALLLDLVDAVEWDEVATDHLMLDREALDGVLFDLSPGERREVGRLLTAELGRDSRS